jgi:tetratricopeptide (TPR) repeat protein
VASARGLGYHSRMIIRALVLVSLAACAGATPASDTFVNQPGGGSGSGSGSGGSGGTASGGDATFDSGPTDVPGLLFEPIALGLPGMPMVTAKKKMPLEGHRAALEKAKDPVVKQAEAAIIATLLYVQSKTQTGDDQKKTLTDARQVLRDTATAVGDKMVDDNTLRMLGSYEIALEDYPSAEKAWGDLVAKAPKDKEEEYNRAWWVYSLLKQFKTADAVAALGSDPITEKQPEFAYVAAWAKYRGGDLPGAWQAIVTALKGWPSIGMRDELQRDVLLFAANTGTPFAAAMKDIEPLLGKGDKAADYKLYTELGFKSYLHAGRWADAIAALDKAVDATGSKVPVEDVPRLRYEQADYSIRLDDPDAVAKYAQQSLAAVAACGGACNAKDTTPIVEAIAGIGRLLGVLYVNDNDPRYYAPAIAIYNAVVPMLAANQPLQESTARDKATLDQWKLKLKPNQGKHDKAAISLLLLRHNPEVEGCYEQFLTSNPKLGGTLTLRLEADQTGVIKGASTEPKAGMADLAAVAGCVGDHARGWKLPTHGAPGVTRITLSYALAPKGQAAGSSPAKP